MDIEMSALFSVNASAAGPDRERAIRSARADWNSVREGCQGGYSCLVKLYDRRITALRAGVSGPAYDCNAHDRPDETLFAGTAVCRLSIGK